MARAKRSLPRRLAAIAVSPLMLMTSGCGAQEGGPGTEVPLLRTPAWGRPGGLRLREQPGGLLLRQGVGPVYRYESGHAALLPAEPSVWDQASGAIAECDRQLPAFELSVASDVLLTLKAPRGRQALVVSSAGQAGSVAPFLGAGHKAPFRQQVFSLPAAQVLGGTLRLPFGRKTTALLACWSPDERFAVYADLVMSVIAIVPLMPEGRQE